MLKELIMAYQLFSANPDSTLAPKIEVGLENLTTKTQTIIGQKISIKDFGLDELSAIYHFKNFEEDLGKIQVINGPLYGAIYSKGDGKPTSIFLEAGILAKIEGFSANFWYGRMLDPNNTPGGWAELEIAKGEFYAHLCNFSQDQEPLSFKNKVFQWLVAYNGANNYGGLGACGEDNFSGALINLEDLEISAFRKTNKQSNQIEINLSSGKGNHRANLAKKMNYSAIPVFFPDKIKNFLDNGDYGLNLLIGDENSVAASANTPLFRFGLGVSDKEGVQLYLSKEAEFGGFKFNFEGKYSKEPQIYVGIFKVM